MLKRIPWGAVALVLLVIGGLLTLQQSLYPWPKRLRHVRLEPSRPILRDADVTPDNAFFYLRQLTSGPSSSEDWSKEYDRFGALGMAGGPYPALEARLTEIAGNLELCRQAAAQPKCQVATAESSAFIMPYLGPVRDVVRNLQFVAERAAAKGDWAAASDTCRLALRTGDALSRGGELLNHLVTYACCTLTCSSLRRFVIENEAPPEFLRGMIQFLNETDRNTEPFAEAMRYQGLQARNIVPDAIRNFSAAREGCKYSQPYFIPPARQSGRDAVGAMLVLPLMGSTPRRTAAHIDAVYSYAIDIAAEPRASGRSIDDEALGFIRHWEWRRMVCSDPLGRIIVGALERPSDFAVDRHWLSVAEFRGTELVLALRLYQQKHDGKLPARLDDLVPDFLPAVPVDPFSPDGEPFLYRVDEGGKWLVYSRGPNLRDDGAVWNYPGYNTAREHRDRLDVIFSASECEQRRDRWRLEHPGEK